MWRCISTYRQTYAEGFVSRRWVFIDAWRPWLREEHEYRDNREIDIVLCIWSSLFFVAGKNSKCLLFTLVRPDYALFYSPFHLYRHFHAVRRACSFWAEQQSLWTTRCRGFWPNIYCPLFTVLFRLKEGIGAHDVLKFKDLITGMAGKIPGMLNHVPFDIPGPSIAKWTVIVFGNQSNSHRTLNRPEGN